MAAQALFQELLLTLVDLIPQLVVLLPQLRHVELASSNTLTGLGALIF